MKNLIKYVIAFCVVFIASDAFSQHNVVKYPTVELKGSDTVICFTLEQGRELAKRNEERKMLLEVNSLQSKELAQMDSIINLQRSQISTYQSIDKAQQVIILEVKKQVDMCDTQRALLEKELKKQKRYKWTAIISGIALNTVTIWITQKL